MLLRNLNIKLGFCNGTIMIVTKLFDKFLEAKSLLTGTKCYISRLPLELSEPQGACILLLQGQTIDKVGIYLPVFDHGQLYVAFSRVRSIETSKI